MTDLTRRSLIATGLAASAAPAVAQIAAPAPWGTTPSKRQIMWHMRQQYAFSCFLINTFTVKEWGYTDESTKLFDPSDFEPDQFVGAARMEGMRKVLTAKQRDRLCLWPTMLTEHCIRNAPCKQAKATWSARSLPGGTFDLIRICKYLPLGVRVTRFAVDSQIAGTGRELATPTCIAAQRMICLPQPISARRLRLRILHAPACPAISEIALFRQAVPAAVTVLGSRDPDVFSTEAGASSPQAPLARRNFSAVMPIRSGYHPRRCQAHRAAS